MYINNYVHIYRYTSFPERERERHTHTQRRRDRDRETETERQRQTETGRETDRHRDRQTETQRERQTDRHIVLVTVRSPLCLQLTPKQIDHRKTDRQTDLKITTPRSES